MVMRGSTTCAVAAGVVMVYLFSYPVLAWATGMRVLIVGSPFQRPVQIFYTPATWLYDAYRPYRVAIYVELTALGLPAKTP